MTDPQVLDRILELQFVLSWAGEDAAQPRRQSWWRTNLIDEYGGYDLLSRLVPRTARWAQYELARTAARHVDGDGLDKQADAANIRTLFHLGPELDTELAERLQQLKASEVDPLEALPALKATATWDASAFAGFLGDLGDARRFEREPFGKRLSGDVPGDPVELIRTLAQGLLPLGERFPRPHAVLR